MPNQKAALEGVELAYKEQGKGQAVVLLHGFCGSSAYWDKLLPLLPDDIRVIAPDLRGHGESTAPEGPYPMEAFAADIVQLFGKLDMGKPILLGHSLGGYITLALAEKQPELLKAFGLIHSTGTPDSEEAKEGRLKGIQTIQEQGLPAFIDGLIPKLFAPAHLESMPEAVQEAKRIGLATSPDGAKASLEGMRTRPDRNDVLRQTKLPVLLVAGEHDKIVPPERAFAASGEAAVQRKLDGVGHMSMMESRRLWPLRSSTSCARFNG
ncbi:alpha/beta fold hydrolase [Paenibacillus sp. TAB 01]|uniref:alpha/beta fold hydrolase n=1 Tax=Paenibacillus sp. TAB 01 TaxID=3368988 RepID=UPI0037503EB0